MTASRFIGRRREMEILEREYLKAPSFVLLTGRRRVGKTRLIKEFIKDKDALYFFCGKTNLATMKEELSESIHIRSGGPRAAYGSLRDVLEAFAMSSEGRKILVLDEFQNMVYADKDVLKDLQDAWDNVLQDKGAMLIICGSHMSVMESMVKDYKNPLYGRLTRHITLKSLPFEEIADDDYAGSVARYAVHGGVPRYMELLGDGDLYEAVDQDVFDPTSMMFDDPSILVGDEIKDAPTYMSILRAMASGNRRPSDIASAVGMQVTSMAYSLDRLEKAGIVRREVPVTDDPAKSKNGIYLLTDYFTSFWFKFVYPYRSQLIMDDHASAMANLKAHFSERHAAFVFEDVCRSMVKDMHQEIGFMPLRTGRYWDRSGTEIDMVSIDEKDKAFVAECKFRERRPVDIHDLNGLKAKTASLKALEGRKITYGLFSVSGFDEGLLPLDVVLVDKGKVIRKGQSIYPDALSKSHADSDGD
ncbi:MAG: ATP-binding protein [Candidatus Methanomethylophilaceae archaeon]|nr:ATP-binding protein [Candidatus Methanomethylophilaceae archaeon]